MHENLSKSEQYDYAPSVPSGSKRFWEPTKGGGYRSPVSQRSKDQGSSDPDKTTKFNRPEELSPAHTSSNPDDFKEHSPLEHYKILSKVGHDKKLVDVHTKLLTEKTEGLSSEDHKELASKLKEAHTKSPHPVLDQASKLHAQEAEKLNTKKKKTNRKKKDDSKSTPEESEGLKNIKNVEYAQRAEKLRENLESHIDNNSELTDEEKSHLQSIADEITSSHDDRDYDPAADKELKQLAKLAGKHGKEPFQASPEGGPTTSPENVDIGSSTVSSPKSDNKPERNTGRPSGGGKSTLTGVPSVQQIAGRLGQAAANEDYGGGSIAASSVEYAGPGAVAVGHKLLGSKKKKESTKKSLRMEVPNVMLYLDLQKSNNAITIGQNTNVRSSRRKMQLDTSYTREPVGVMGGPGNANDPDKGPPAEHGVSLEEELEDQRRAYAKREEAQGTIISKSLSFLQSANSTFQEQLDKYCATPEEIEFMTKHLGYTESQIYKGQAKIAGKDISRFSSWLLDSYLDSTRGLSNG